MLRVYPHPDWSGYAAVSFVAATVDETSRRIAVGIRDIGQSERSAEVRYMAGFDVSREPTHYRIMFEELNRRIPDLRLASDEGLPVRPSNFIVGLESMPVRFSPSASEGWQAE